MNNFFKNLSERSRFFSRNTAPKIVSIVFALVMWLYVMGEVNPDMTTELTNMKVQLLNVEDLRNSGLVIIGQEDYTVNVKISGRRNDIFKVSPKDITVSADLRGFHKGVNSVPLDISSPANVRTEVSPKQIKVTLDELVKKQKPVAIETVGTAVEGFDPAVAVISPSEVIVEGPETLVNSVARVIGEVNLDNKKEDIFDKIPLTPVNSQGKVVNGVEVKSKYAEVTLPLHRLKTVKIALEYEGKVKEGYLMTSLIANPEVIQIKGPRELVDGIQEVKAKKLNIEGLDTSQERILELMLPEGITISSGDKNPTVAIAVEELRTKEFIFKENEIAIDRLDNQYKVKIYDMPDGVKVTVTAARSIIDTLTKADIQLYFDAGGLAEGKHTAKLSVTVNKLIEKVTLYPENISFEIKPDKESQPASGDNQENPNNN